MNTLTLFAMTVSLAVLALFIGLRRALQGDPSMQERLRAYAWKPRLRESGSRSHQKDRGTPSLRTRLDQVISNRDFAARMATDLARANLKLTVPEYMLLRVACIGLGFLLGVMVSRRLLPGIALGIVAFFLPGWYLRRQQRKRRDAFTNQLSDVLTLLVGSLRAGYGFLHAVDIMIEEIASPASEEFARVLREVGLGLSLPEALSSLVRRMDSDDLELIVTAINIQHEVGGNLADILETISETIRHRVRIQGEIKVITTQQKITGNVLAGLPFILGGILFVLNPDYMMRLFTPGWTLIIPAGAVVGMLLGYLAIRHIVAIDV